MFRDCCGCGCGPGAVRSGLDGPWAAGQESEGLQGELLPGTGSQDERPGLDCTWHACAPLELSEHTPRLPGAAGRAERQQHPAAPCGVHPVPSC